MPSSFAPSKGVFFDFEASVQRSSTKGAPGSKSTRSAGAPFSSRPVSSPRRRDGLSAEGAKEGRQAHVAPVVEPQRRRQEGFETDRARGGSRRAGASLPPIAAYAFDEMHGQLRPEGRPVNHRTRLCIDPLDLGACSHLKKVFGSIYHLAVGGSRDSRTR